MRATMTAAVLGAMVAGGPARAQPVHPSATPEWTAFAHTRTGASYCPLLETWQGNSLCLSFGCTRGGQMEVDAVVNGRIGSFAETGQRQLVLRIDVEGRPEWAEMLLSRVAAEPSANVYRQGMTAMDAGILDALAAGRGARISIRDGSAEGRLAVGLRGSGRAIAAARRACRLP